MEYQSLTHQFGPVYDKDSKILILGSFPSVKSREVNFYYGHPQNRFWKVMAAVVKEAGAAERKEDFCFAVPGSVEEKREFLLQNHIALWDVIYSCDISGSSDSSIKNVVPNRLGSILDFCEIRMIFANGKTAGRLYEKYIKPETKREICILPSTSPANAAFGLEKLSEIWKGEMVKYL